MDSALVQLHRYVPRSGSEHSQMDRLGDSDGYLTRGFLHCSWFLLSYNIAAGAIESAMYRMQKHAKLSWQTKHDASISIIPSKRKQKGGDIRLK